MKTFKNILILFGLMILTFIIYVYIGYQQAENRLEYYFSDQYKEDQKDKIIKLNLVQQEVNIDMDWNYDALFFHEEKTLLLRNLTKSEFHTKKVRSDFIVVDDHTDFHEWYVVIWEVDDLVEVYADKMKENRLVFVTKNSDKFTGGCRYYVFDWSKSKLWELMNFRNLFWYVYQFWEEECLWWEIWDNGSRWYSQDVSFETEL